MKENRRKDVAIIGAGLAGSEAAWQLAKQGHPVDLFEMRPHRLTEAHKTGYCAELVCSNSFKSQAVENAHGLLKAEMSLFDALILKAAEQCAIPAGQALAVDRTLFSEWITHQLEAHPLIQRHCEEVADLQKLLSEYAFVLVATGPLTTPDLAISLEKILGQEYLSFYDAIAPIVTAESVDMSVAFKASRYNKGTADYINCPMNRDQYYSFIHAILEAEKTSLHQFENIRPFEGCLPIEVMAERGVETLRYGPMKPVGLCHPQTGERYHAVLQLRQDDAVGSLYNMVGFQTKMTWTAQKEIFRQVPGLENAEFVRMGSIHRNTFINSPQLLTPQLHLKSNPRLFFAGQITGVEGYMESTATGIIAAHQIASKLSKTLCPSLPATTMMGALVRYITQTDSKTFQPINANFGLLEGPLVQVGKKERKAFQAEYALQTMKDLQKKMDVVKNENLLAQEI